MESQPQVLFGKKVRAVREALHVSRELAAEKSGITANYLGEVERGEKMAFLGNHLRDRYSVECFAFNIL